MNVAAALADALLLVDVLLLLLLLLLRLLLRLRLLRLRLRLLSYSASARSSTALACSSSSCLISGCSQNDSPPPGRAGSSVVPELKAAGVWDTATLVLAFVSRPRPSTASTTEAREQGEQSDREQLGEGEEVSEGTHSASTSAPKWPFALSALGRLAMRRDT